MRTFLIARVSAIVALTAGFVPVTLSGQVREPLEALSGRIEAWNRDLAALSPAPSAAMRTLLQTRAAEMARLMEIDPGRAIALTLPADVAGRWLSVAPVGAIEVSAEWQGEAEVVVVDDFAQGTSETRTWLRLDGSRTAVYFGSERPKLKSGDILRVRGSRLGAAIAAFDAGAVTAASDGCTTTGPQNAVALLVNMPGYTLPDTFTPARVREGLFGASRTSLAEYWREFSYGRASASGDVFGPFTTIGTYACTDILGGLSEVIRTADSKVDFKQYNRILLYTNYPCFQAMSTIGCFTLTSPAHGSFQASAAALPLGAYTRTSTNTETVAMTSVIHETGHSLGLAHSDTTQYGSIPLGDPLAPVGNSDEIGDIFSPMGNANILEGNRPLTRDGLPHFNSPQKSLLGWLGPSEIQTVETSGTFTVQPIETQGGGVKALRVRRRAGLSQYLWIEYRQPIGYDALAILPVTMQATRGAMIHLEDPTQSLTNPQWHPRTHLLDFTAAQTPRNFYDPALEAGSRWSDPYGTLSLTVNSATPSGLSITVNYENPCPRPALTSVTLAPGVLTASIPVEGNCASSSSTSTSWIRITSGATLSGPGNVDLTVTANLSPMPRTGQVAVAGQIVAVIQPPVSPPTISPASGKASAGVLQQFQITFPNYTGTAALTLAEALFSKDGGTTNACWVVYQSGRNSVALYDDKGTAGANAAPPFTTNSDLHNSQCSLEATSVQVNGSSLILTVSIRFTSDWTGSLKLYARAWDGAGAPPSFLELGSWSVEVPPGPQIKTGGVVNAASSLAGAIAPGEFVTVYGTAMGPAQGISLSSLSTAASGARLLIDGTYAFLTYVSVSQINALVPYGIARTGNVAVQAEYNGVRGNTVIVPVAESSPGIFTLNYGSGQAVAVNQDGTLNSASNPAPRGSYIAFWATGQGLLDPTQPDGQNPAGPPFPRTSLPVSVSLGTIEVPEDHIAFTGLVYAGVIQVNLRIPDAVIPGEARPLVVRIGRGASPMGATIAIR